MRRVIPFVSFLTVVSGVVAVASIGRTAPSGPVPGDTVEFLLPADADQPMPAGAPTDKVLYTGGRVTNIDASTCGGAMQPVQSGVLVDPGASLGVGRSPRLVGMITISHVDPIHPGIRLTAISFDAACDVGGVPYHRYRGTVE